MRSGGKCCGGNCLNPLLALAASDRDCRKTNWTLHGGSSTRPSLLPIDSEISLSLSSFSDFSHGVRTERKGKNKHQKNVRVCADCYLCSHRANCFLNYLTSLFNATMVKFTIVN